MQPPNKKVLVCDFCKKRPGSWFGQTSVVVCSEHKCQKAADDSWKAHCEAIDSEKRT
jgi:hypothetical protein